MGSRPPAGPACALSLIQTTQYLWKHLNKIVFLRNANASVAEIKITKLCHRRIYYPAVELKVVKRPATRWWWGYRQRLASDGGSVECRPRGLDQEILSYPNGSLLPGSFSVHEHKTMYFTSLLSQSNQNNDKCRVINQKPANVRLLIVAAPLNVRLELAPEMARKYLF